MNTTPSKPPESMELKTCPFCGHSPLSSKQQCSVWCANDYCQNYGTVFTPNGWNTRIQLPTPQAKPTGMKTVQAWFQDWISGKEVSLCNFIETIQTDAIAAERDSHSIDTEIVDFISQVTTASGTRVIQDLIAKADIRLFFSEHIKPNLPKK